MEDIVYTCYFYKQKHVFKCFEKIIKYTELPELSDLDEIFNFLNVEQSPVKKFNNNHFIYKNGKYLKPVYKSERIRKKNCLTFINGKGFSFSFDTYNIRVFRTSFLLTTKKDIGRFNLYLKVGTVKTSKKLDKFLKKIKFFNILSYKHYRFEDSYNKYFLNYFNSKCVVGITPF